MKLKSKFLALCFVVLLALGCAIGFAACGETEQTEQPAETKSYIVTVTCDETKGSYTLTPSANADGKYEEGTSVTLTVTPEAEYEVDSVKVNGSAVAPTENKYTFKVESDTTVVVAFKDKTVVPPEEQKVNLTLTYTEAEGTVTADPAPVDGKVAKGVSVTITVTPGENYEVDSVKVNGTPVELTDDHYTFEANADTTVEVAFKTKTVVPPVDEKVSLTLTYTEAEGMVTADPAPVDGKVAKGVSVTITVTPGENYEVDSVKVNGTPVELTDDHYTFEANADTTVEVTFKAKIVSYDVTVTLTEGGRYRMTQEGAASHTLPSTTSEGGTFNVVPGKDTDVTVTIYLYSDAGYKLKSITVGGVDKTQELEQEKDGRYVYTSFTLTASCEIALTWEKVEETYKVTIDFDGQHGSVRYHDFTTSIDKPLEDLEHVTYGTRVHLLISTDGPDYEVTLLVNGEPVKLTASSYFCFIYEDTTFTVSFELNETAEPGSNVEFSVGLTPALNAGTYTLSSYGPYTAGDTVILTVMPYSGYVTGSVTANGKPISPKTEGGSEYELTLTASVTRVEIVFEEENPVKPAELSVSVTPELNAGTYALSSYGSYKVGDTVTLTVSPYSGYVVESVTANGEPISPKTEGGNEYEVILTASVTKVEIVFVTESDPDPDPDPDPEPEPKKDAKLTVQLTPALNAGTYTLSGYGSNKEGDTVTLTVMPYSGYSVGSVTFNEQPISPNSKEESGLVYELTLAAGKNIVEILFEEKGAGNADTYDIFVTCGSEGSYTLSPEKPYASGSEVLLTITPQDGYYVSSVTVDGEEVGLVNGEYTFTISDDTVIVIEFGESLFAAELTGKWSPLLSAGALGYELTLKGKSVIFSETEDEAQEYPVSEAGSGSYTFTVIDEENETTEFTFSFLGTVNGGKLLVLSHTENGETEKSYYLLEGVDYFTFEYSLVLVGNWVPTVTYGYPVEITETGVFYAGSPAVVLSYNAETYEIVLLDGTLTYTKSNDRLKFTPSDPDSNVVEYYREIPAGPVAIPFLAGSWKTLDESHSVTVDELGNFFYDGTQYEIRSNDSSGAMKSYYFTIPGSGRWDVDFYGRVVWVHQGYDEDKSFTMYSGEPFPVVVDCGEGGSYTISIEYDGEVSTEERAEGYPIGTQITITFTANEGYAIDYVYEDVNGEMSRYSSTHGMKTFTLVFTVQQNWYDYHQEGRRAQATFIPEEDV